MKLQLPPSSTVSSVGLLVIFGRSLYGSGVSGGGVTGSPIMAGIPLIIPAIMIGNIILCVATHFFYNKFKYKGKLATGMIVGSVLKALFMFAVIVKCLLPLLSENIKVPAEKLPGVLKVASTQFGLTQLITALIGSALAWVIWMTVGKSLKNGSKEN